MSAGGSATMRDLCKGNVKLRYLADTFNNPSSAITGPRECHTLTLHAIDHFMSAGGSATMRDLCKGNVKLRNLADALTTRLLRLLNQENDIL
jgi:hypothetical protein